MHGKLSFSGEWKYNLWKHVLLHENISLSNENIPVLNENIFDRTLLISATIVY